MEVGVVKRALVAVSHQFVNRWLLWLRAILNGLGPGSAR